MEGSGLPDFGWYKQGCREFSGFRVEAAVESTLHDLQAREVLRVSLNESGANSEQL